MILYFLLDLPEDPQPLLDSFLPRIEPVWTSLDLVQVRAKHTGAAAYVAAVERVRESVARGGKPGRAMTRGERGLRRNVRGGRPLILVNDRLDVALAAGADGVHVGAGDLPPERIREAATVEDLVVGLTCHTAAELTAAPARGADYVGVGSFFPSRTKAAPLPDPRPALRELREAYPLPLYAIGGITAERLEGLIADAPQIDGIVVSEAIQAASDPARAVRDLRARIAGLDRRARPV